MTPGAETFTVDIQKPAAGGRMLARRNGQVVLVSGAIPGERVTVRVTRATKDCLFADTVAVEVPSPDRQDPLPDPLCGGCLFSHIRYDAQLRLKEQIVEDAFARIARMPAVRADMKEPFTGPSAIPPREGYRMRARLHARGWRFGYFREGTHELCDAASTRQLLASTCEVLDRMTSVTRSLRLESLHEIALSENVDASDRVIAIDSPSPVEARSLERLSEIPGLTGLLAGATSLGTPFVVDHLEIEGKSLELRRHVLAFFQGNRYLLRDLVAHVVERVPRGSELVDLYAGVGLFSVAAAVCRGARVTAVEGDRTAAADLAANAHASGAAVVAVQQPVESFTTAAGAATVIVDPPRTGMSREACEVVSGLRPSRLIYVSCDAATLARDARRLVDMGLTVEEVSTFDLFPNTPHVEAVTVFVRGA